MHAPRLLLVLPLLGACAMPVPETPGAAASARQDYPELRPLSQLLATADARPDAITPGVTGALQGRAARLRARAAVMRGGALSPADRARIRAGLARLAAARAEG